MLTVDENDMNASNLEKILGEWALDFNNRVAEPYCTKAPRYSELRSSALRNYL